MPRRRRRGLASWLTESSTPVFVLDARRVVLFFNQGCEALTGWQAADVVGKTCVYAGEPDASQVESLTASLCPPPEALAGEAIVAPVTFHRRDGIRFEQSVHFLPLTAAEPAELHIIGFVLPPQVPETAQRDSPLQLHARLAALRSELRERYRLDDVIAHSPGMLRTLQQAQVAAECDSAVHLTGEPGTGRSWLARGIHHHTPRQSRAFVPLDCEQLPPFELKRTLRRLFETVEEDPAAPEQTPGAVYLSRVSQMPRDLQQLLLELLDRSDRGRAPRLYSSDSKSLDAAVQEELLLPELFYVLTPLVVQLPPLRERREDLPLLAQHLIEECNRTSSRQLGGLTPEAIEQFSRYNWPGNVQELRLVIEEAHGAARGQLLTVADLPFRFRTGVDAQQVGPPPALEPIDLTARLEEFERLEIQRVLRHTRQNKSRAAEMLGLTRTRLYRRMEQLGLIEGNGPESAPG